MSKPKKVKRSMPAPERRDMVALAMFKRAQSQGAHVDKRKRRNRHNEWRNEVY
jgi:hypothetical protein